MKLDILFGINVDELHVCFVWFDEFLGDECFFVFGCELGSAFLPLPKDLAGAIAVDDIGVEFCGVDLFFIGQGVGGFDAGERFVFVDIEEGFVGCGCADGGERV